MVQLLGKSNRTTRSTKSRFACIARGFISLLQLSSILFFYYGFFPVKPAFKPTPPAELAERAQFCNFNSNRKHVDRVVFILLDALRADFVLDYPGAEHQLAKLQFAREQVLQNRSFAYVAFAQTPTVTMPRIKAFTSGSVPSFVDVLLNFGSTKLEDDNLLQQLLLHGRSVDFYGDDTWLKLFPKTFRHFEGTDSFRVSDYTEVDTNVTRHIDSALKSPADAADFLILHYIGLDHIGHLIGPYCHLVAPKLHEFSNIVSQVYTHLIALDAADPTKRSLLVLVGDHGMTYDGNHGGNSLSELQTPLILVPIVVNSHQSSNVTKRLAQLAQYDPLHAVNQVDLVSTLSILLGLPIPSGNVGRILPAVLQYYMELSLLETSIAGVSTEAVGEQNVLQAMCSNALQLISVAEMQSNFADSYTLRPVFDRLWQNRNYKEINKFLTDLSFKLTTLVSSYDNGKIFTGFAGICVACVLQLFSIMYSDAASERVSVSSNFLQRQKYLLLVLTACIVHGATHFASSYVEEEHRLVYFYAACFHIMLFIAALRYYAVDSNKSFSRNAQSQSSATLVLLYTIGFISTMRLLQAWNSTGDKWAHLPDISDALNSDRWALLVCFVSAVILYQIFASIKLPHFIAAVCIVSIIRHRMLMGSLLISSDAVHGAEPQTAVLFYTIILLTLLWYTFYEQNFNGALATVIMFNCLLQRPANVICMLIFIYAVNDVLIPKILQPLLKKSTLNQKDAGAVCSVAVYVYLVHASMVYYAFGNSNKLNTVDVAAGFTGFPHFQPIMNGFLIVSYTFSVYAMVVVIGIRHVSQLYYNNFLRFRIGGESLCWWHDVSNVLLMQQSVLLVFAFAAALHFRYHLFTWSVFAPKILYAGCFWLVAQLVFWLTSVCLYFNTSSTDGSDGERRRKRCLTLWWPFDRVPNRFFVR